MYPKYMFSFIRIILGATDFLMKNMRESLMKFGFSEESVGQLIIKLQVLSALVTVKIVKTYV